MFVGSWIMNPDIFPSSWNISNEETRDEVSMNSTGETSPLKSSSHATNSLKQLPSVHPAPHDRWGQAFHYASWSDQRDSSQHSRGSIWTDDHSRSSHASHNTFSSLQNVSETRPLSNENTFAAASAQEKEDNLEKNLSRLALSSGNADLNAFGRILHRHSSSSQESLSYSPVPAPVARSNSLESQPSPFNGISAFPPASSSMSVGSSIPSLVPASSGSTAAMVSHWHQAQRPPGGKPPESSLAKAAAAGRSKVVPPPGFPGDDLEFGGVADNMSPGPSTSANSRSNRRVKTRDRQRSNKKKVRPGSELHSNSRESGFKELENLTDSTRSISTGQRAPYPVENESVVYSEALRQLMGKAKEPSPLYPNGSLSSLNSSALELGPAVSLRETSGIKLDSQPILPQQPPLLEEPDFRAEVSDDDETFPLDLLDDDDDDDEDESWEAAGSNPYGPGASSSPRTKKREWLLRMNKRLAEIPVGQLDPSSVPILAVMNAWAKTKSSQGASMVEMWLKRAQEEFDSGNERVIPTTKMYTMAVDAWARSGEGGPAAQRAEALLQHMYQLYQAGGHEALCPTNAIFNAVINAWARSREKIAPMRAEQILNWMQNLQDLDIQPDKYTFNTVIHAWAKAGGTEAASKAQELLARMHKMYQEGNLLAKPDTISYNVVINAWAKSGGRGAAAEAEKLLAKMHRLHELGDPDVKPNVVTYGAVIDSFAKSGERGAASRADALLANMIQLYQSDQSKHADLLPNTYVFNTVINCWAKSKEHDAASKAEEMLVAMSRLHASGMPSLKPDNFTYTAVIDAWAKSGYRGAAARADQLLDKMEAKYLAGDTDLKPNSYTYNAVICALAKSGEAGAAARAERVLQNMVNRHRNGGDEDVKPTTINFNTVLDAWAKSGGGRAAAERAEEILEWMDRLHKNGNPDLKVDTISFNAVLDAWARSGDRIAPRRAEQILDHMDELYRSGNTGVKPDRYTYNTLINVWAKSGERGSAARAEHVLSVMERRFRDGDEDFKPNTRTYTSVIDAWAKSGEKGAARRAEQILNNMISRYEAAGDPDVKPNVHTANTVCNACAFSKNEEDREEALQIAFRVFNWLASQPDMDPDSYTYTILLSVCANLLPRDDAHTRYANARAFFESCRDAGYVNDYVLRKLRQTVTEEEYLELVEYRTDPSASSMPPHWTRNAKLDNNAKGRKGSGSFQGRRRGK